MAIYSCDPTRISIASVPQNKPALDSQSGANRANRYAAMPDPRSKRIPTFRTVRPHHPPFSPQSRGEGSQVEILRDALDAKLALPPISTLLPRGLQTHMAAITGGEPVLTWQTCNLNAGASHYFGGGNSFTECSVRPRSSTRNSVTTTPKIPLASSASGKTSTTA